MNLTYERASQQLREWTSTPSLLNHARAVEVGLGISSPGEIELISDDDEGRLYATRVREILAKG